jgi:hypothetical protein
MGRMNVLVINAAFNQGVPLPNLDPLTLTSGTASCTPMPLRRT